MRKSSLLTKVQNSGLAAAVAQLRFTVATNHLNSEVSQTPDFKLSRKIKATNSSMGSSGHGYECGRGGCGRGGGRGRGGRGGRGETQKTTYYSIDG